MTVTFNIKKCTGIPCEFSYELPVGNDPRIATLVDTFLEEQRDLLASLSQNSSPQLLNRLQTLHTCPITREQLLSGCHLAKSLLSRADLPINDPVRFKVLNFLSITVIKSEDQSQNTFVIHLKKKNNRVFLNKGNEATVCSALLITIEKITWIAEATMLSTFTRQPKHLWPKSDALISTPKNYVTPYAYTGKTALTSKYCLLTERFHTDLFECLNTYQTTYNQEGFWKIFWEVLQFLNTVHRNNFTYKDLKLENILIKFSFSQEGINLQEISFIDFSTLEVCLPDARKTPSPSCDNIYGSWMGSEDYWPQQKTIETYQELQGQHSDIYALGVLLIELSRSVTLAGNDTAFINRLHLQLSQKNFRHRPNIQTVCNLVQKHLMQDHSNYSWLPRDLDL